MPLYLTKFSYTPETWARLIGNPEDRRKAAQSYIESVGGKLHGFWYAFGAHAVHLERNSTRAACRTLNPSDLGNLAYPFRAAVYPGQRLVQFKGGRYEDRWEISGGKVEWTMEIEKQKPILEAGERAVLLR